MAENSEPAVAADQTADFDTLPPASPRSLGVVPGLVWAFKIRGDGCAEPLSVTAPIEVPLDGWLWLHLNLGEPSSGPWLRSMGLPAPALTMLVSRDRHQQLHVAAECAYGVLADLVRRFDGPSDDIGYLRFVMTDQLLISGRHNALTAVESAKTSIEHGGRRLSRVAALLELIIEKVVAGIESLADQLGNELDQIEDELATESERDVRQQLGRVRRTAVKMHRQLTGLRALFHRIERDGATHLNPALRIAAGDLAQHLDGLDRVIIELRDRARLLQEDVTLALAEATNRHVNTLSILTTLLLPPTLITGVFGMNVKGLPFAEDENAFFWTMAVMLAAAVAVYLLMRRIGVFKN
jgi:zinc transporter